MAKSYALQDQVGDWVVAEPVHDGAHAEQVSQALFSSIGGKPDIARIVPGLENLGELYQRC
jgi:hypothetical protein